MQIAILVSTILIIFGITCLLLARKLRKRSLHLFFAALFLQTGLFLLLNSINAIHIDYPKAWPLLSIFTGTALLPASWHRKTGIKANIVISAAFIVLGIIMMIFALKLTPFPLSQFVRDWWLLLVLLTGLILTLITLGTRFSIKPEAGSADAGKPEPKE